jgi:uncharacterized membrane protein
MEFVLLGLLVLSFPIIAIVALVKTVNINDRLRTFERRLAALELRPAGAPGAAPPPQPAPQPEPAPVSLPPTPPPAAAAKSEPPLWQPAPPPPAPEPAAAPAPPAAPPPPPPTAPAAPEPAISFEERFGTQWTVWIGGLALALGGIFLVKYSIEAGLIGPKLRLFFGALLAAALVCAGEWTRRQDQIAGFAGLPTAHIPSILTAAGTTVAYATVYAAYGLYEFLNPAVAFVLLGAVALATLAAALLHGPALAALGLVGAYVTPLLVASAEPNYWALYVYLAVVTAAAFALARMRLWRWLAFTAVGFSFFWVLPGIEPVGVQALGAHLFHAGVSFVLVAAMIVSELFYGPSAEPGEIDPVSCVALSASLLAALIVTLKSGHDPAALTIFTALIVATLAIAWRTDAAAAAVPVAAILVYLVIARWAFDAEVGHLIAPPGAAGEAAPQPWRTGLGSHMTLGFGFAILFGAAGFLAQGRSAAPVIAILWSAASVATPLLILIALYWRIAGFERSIPFAGLALLLAALNGIATEVLGKRAPRPGIAAAGALYATGTVAALALAFTFALEKGWLTVALALMVPGIAWIAEQRPFPMLRWLAAAVVVLVVARVGWQHGIVGSDVGTTPIFNWILYGYGIPAASFWVAGHLLRRRADDQPCRMVESAAILFTVLLANLEIRHFMNGGNIYANLRSPLGETGLQVCVWLAMAIGLEHIRHRTQSIVHDVGAQLLAALSLLGIVFGLWILANPMTTNEPVGAGPINLILLGYGIPAVLAITLAMTTRGLRPNVYRVVAAATAVLLMLSYLSLEVRAIFHAPFLGRGPTGNAEQYTYSVVWLAYGVALLLFGIWQRSQPARLASAAVTLLTIAKVFLVDTADLTGVYRALSLIGLGAVLVGIAWLYQHWLFPRAARLAAIPAPGATST